MYRRRFDDSEVELVETKVWICTNKDCNGWVRDNFKSSECDTPICPLCKSKMTEGTKMLQEVHSGRKYK